MNKIILLLSFIMVSGFAIGQTAPIKKKNYVDEQRILNVEAATPRTGYISAPYRKTDGRWYEKDENGVESTIVGREDVYITTDVPTGNFDYKMAIDTVGIDTIYINNNSNWDRFESGGGGSSITDGVTIIGAGGVGDSLRVDTSLIATKTDIGNINEFIADGVTILENGTLDTINYIATKTDLLNVSVDTINEIATKYDLTEIKTHFFATIGDIPTTLNIGDRAIVNSTGNQYFVQTDSILYYETDGENVIDLTGKYAVIDLSKKRQFETIEELKKLIHFLSIEDGETVHIKDDIFEIRFSYKKYRSDFEDSIDFDRTIDGYFIDTIQTDVNKNLIHYSEDIYNKTVLFPDGNYNPFVLFSGNTGTFIQNGAIAPDGSRTAEIITNWPASKSITIYGQNKEIEIGDDVTFSFYAKGLPSGGTGANPRMRANSMPTGGTFSDIPITLDGAWHRYERTATATTTSTGNGYFWFGLFSDFAAEDSLAVWGFQIEVGSFASPYNESNWDKDSRDRLYLYRKNLIKAKVLDLTSIKKSNISISGANTDSDFIQSAIDYCDQGYKCNTVLLPADKFLITKKIVIPRGVKLIGANDGYRVYGANNPSETTTTEFNIDLDIKTDYAIEMIPTGLQQILDNSGFSNITLIAVDTIEGFVYTNEIAGCTFENITSQINTSNTNTGFVNFAAWNMTVNPSSDNHYNSFYKVAVGGSSLTPYGFIYEGGVGNSFKNCSFSADTSLLIVDGNFDGHMITVETGNTGVFVKDGNSTISHLYTEASAYNGGSTIKMVGGSLKLENSYLQTNTTTDTLFNIIEAQNFSVKDSEIILQGVVNFGQEIKSMTFENVGSVSELRDYLNLNSRQKAITNLTNNYNVYNNDVSEYKSETGATKQRFGFSKESTFENITIADSLNLSKIILNGKSENLSSLSDSLGIDFVGIFATTTNNVVIAPDGTMTADKIEATGTIPSSSIHDKTSIENFIIGEPYTISVYLKNLGGTGNMTFNPRLGFNVTGGPTASFSIVSDEWQRYEKTVYATVSANDISLRVNNLTINDSIAVWGFQVNRGYHATAYVPTISTGIDNKDIVINTAENKKIDFTSPLDFSNYGSGTTTGTETYLLGVESDGDVVEVDLANGMDAVVSSRSYVDNTAALVDLVSGQVYYNTTSNTFVVLP